MPMAITEIDKPAMTVILASDSVELAAGQTLKIESSPAGEELFARQVPAGKAWSQVDVSVRITEVPI